METHSLRNHESLKCPFGKISQYAVEVFERGAEIDLHSNAIPTNRFGDVQLAYKHRLTRDCLHSLKSGGLTSS